MILADVQIWISVPLIRVIMLPHGILIQSLSLTLSLLFLGGRILLAQDWENV